MEFISCRNNYHIKYEDYFRLDASGNLRINKGKYYLESVVLKPKETIEPEFMGRGIYQPPLISTEVILKIKRQSKEKIDKNITFIIKDFSTTTKYPNHCIYIKYGNTTKLLNGEIYEDFIELKEEIDIINNTKKTYYIVTFNIKYYS